MHFYISLTLLTILIFTASIFDEVPLELINYNLFLIFIFIFIFIIIFFLDGHHG